MRSKPKAATGSEQGFILGRQSFAKISAVEGIHLTDSMKKDFREFERKGLSAEQRRQMISAKYGVKS